jgi:hypothetical protein
VSPEKKPPVWREPLESQYAAALEMLGNAMRACPPPLWDDSDVPVAQRFWYLAFHTLFWTDRDQEPNEQDHRPPAPFTLDELDPAGVYPERTYTPLELLAYLEHVRGRCRAALGALDEKRAASRCGVAAREMNVLEMYLYSLRHVQHHTAQLQLLLRQGAGMAPGWVGRGRW